MINTKAKVLVISHNLYSASNNVGKTLSSLLSQFSKENIYSLYFRNELPDQELCEESFLIDDKSVFKATLTLGIKKCGKIIKYDPSNNVSCSDAERALYRLGNKRKPIISYARDLMWHIGFWKNRKLKEWIKSISPDLILFVPNEYTLAFDVLKYVKKIADVPVITYYMDDVFYYNQKTKGIDKLRRKKLFKLGKYTAKISNCFFTTCKLMTEEYKKLFNKECYEFGNCISLSNETFIKDEINKISYIGNLHSDRWNALLDIGACLKQINIENDKSYYLDIYSASDLNQYVLDKFNENEYIRFLGRLNVEEVKKVQIESDLLVHVESMNEFYKKSTRLSVSTKIFEYLAVGKPILAYGPNDVASMHFLENTNASVAGYSKEDLKEKLNRLLVTKEIDLHQLAKNGKIYANKHCNLEIESTKFCEIIIKNIYGDKNGNI